MFGGLFWGFQFLKQYFAYKINQKVAVSHFLLTKPPHFCAQCLWQLISLLQWLVYLLWLLVSHWWVVTGFSASVFSSTVTGLWFLWQLVSSFSTLQRLGLLEIAAFCSQLRQHTGNSHLILGGIYLCIFLRQLWVFIINWMSWILSISI